jgi:PadR family transcriptional regulator PadR
MGDLEKAILLSILKANNSSCGMDILSHIDKTIDKDLSHGAVYTTLKRMKAKGYLSSEDIDSDKRRGTTITYYSVTTAGKDSLCKSMTDLLSLFTKSLDSSLGWNLLQATQPNVVSTAETHI